MANDGKYSHISHEINRRGKAIFRDKTTWCIVNELTEEDYAKDFSVEMIEKTTRLVTGVFSYIQLKSQLAPSIHQDGRSVSYSLSKSDLAYWCDRLTLPLFVVIVDVERKEGWFLFIQKYMEAQKDWRNQDSFTVNLPIENSISNREAFEAAIEAAFEYMRAKGGSPQDALKWTAEQLEKLDPRFRITASARSDSQNTHFDIQPKEGPIKVNWIVKGEQADKKLHELVNQGKPVQFGAGEFTTEDTQIFKPWENHSATVQFQQKAPCTAHLKFFDKKGKLVSELPNINGVIVGGKMEQHFHGMLPGSPFLIEVGPVGTPGLIGHISFRLNLAAWERKEILLLPFYDQLSSFISGHAVASKMTITGYVGGMVQFHVQPKFSIPSAVNLFGEVLKLLDTAREVARTVKASPTFRTQEIVFGDWPTGIRLISNFLRRGRAQLMKWNGNFDFTSASFTDAEVRRNKGKTIEDHVFPLSAESTLPFMDTNVSLGEMVIEIDKARCIGRRSKEGRSLLVKGTGKSVLRLRRLTPEELASVRRVELRK